MPWERHIGPTLSIHRNPLDVKIGTLKRLVSGQCVDQTVGQWTRCQCHDGDSDFVSDEMNHVLRDSGITNVLGDACEVGRLYAEWS